MSYVIAAYAVTAIAIVGYGLHLVRERARLVADLERADR
jgi:heme exporter protein D